MASVTENLSIRDQASALILSLPETVTWEEVQYALYVRQKIELGLAASEAGRLLSTEEVQRRFEERKRSRISP